MRASRAAKSKPPTFQEGRLGYAVGDIHGRADLLENLFTQMEQDSAHSNETPLVVFAGDYIDRGPDSRKVIDLLLSGRPYGFERRFLMGNHERMLLDCYDEPAKARRWLNHGGFNTMRSYGVRPPSMGAAAEVLVEALGLLRDRMSAEHQAFLRRLERYVEAGDYLFVHAGVDPSKPLAQQTDADLFWIRKGFLDCGRQLSHRVVHGHTPVRAAGLEGSRLAIDTGAYATGVLTAARLEGAGVSFLTARDAVFSRA
ncbi:MAG: metallophosphoesterase [Terricaulis sp.]